MKNKKKLLLGVAAMGLVAVATGAVSTMAWFQASGAATISTTSSDEKTFTVDYEEFTTSLGSVTVTLTFVEQTSNKDLQLAHYFAEDPDTTGPKVAGWNQCYTTQAGTEVWNAAEPPANAYGKVAGGHAAAYYRVYRIHVAYTLTADQAATVPTSHTITGEVAIASSDNSMIFWNNGASVPNTDGKTSTPGANDFDKNAKAFTAIDLTTSWTAGAGAKQQDGDYICVSCDGVVHTANEDITGTLSFSNVAP